MRICFDLDGVISGHRADGEDYSKVQPLPGAVATLQRLKAEGHYIIIHTARRMRTHAGNVGLVIADIGAQTQNWLASHQIPYDELHFGKPFANLYVDDNALRFGDWDQFLKELPVVSKQYSGPAR